MAEQRWAAITIHYRPAPPALGANLKTGAHVQVEGVDGGPFEGVVVPGEASRLQDQLPPEAHEALNDAATSGAAGESGRLDVELGSYLPW